MKRKMMLPLCAAIAIALLAAAIFAKAWVFYLLIGCLVFAGSTLHGRGRRKG